MIISDGEILLMGADLEEAGGGPRRDPDGVEPRELGSARLVDARALFEDAFAFCAWLSGERHPLDAAIGLRIHADGPPRPSLGSLAWTVGPLEPGDRPALLVASLWPITEEHLGALLVLLARAGDGRAIVVAPTFGREALDVLRWVSAMASPSQQLRLVAVSCRFITVDGSRPAPLLETVLDTAERTPDELQFPRSLLDPSRSLESARPADPSPEAGPAAGLASPGVPGQSPREREGTEPPSSSASPAAGSPAAGTPTAASPRAPGTAGGPAGALWTAYVAKIGLGHPDWRVVEQSETRCLLEPPGRDVVVAAEALPGFRLRASLVVGPVGQPTQAEARFGLLERARGAFEQRFGGALAWEALPLRGVFRISDYAAGDPAEIDEHADYVRFLGETAERLVLAYDSVLGAPAGEPGSASAD